MHWKELLKGSALFRRKEPRAHYYHDYLSEKNWERWNSPCVSDSEVERLFKFLNQWSSRYPSDAEAVASFKQAYKRVFPVLTALEGQTIEDIDFERRIYEDFTSAEAIRQVFDHIARCGVRYESTATSKILHTINPSLFVMWDEAIRGGYAVQVSGQQYAHRFLPRVQKELTQAIATCMRETQCDRTAAIAAIRHLGGDTFLTKLADEYNYAKFTLNIEELWQC